MTPKLVEAFESMFLDFKNADLTTMADVYDPQVVFRDPVHRLTGLPELRTYLDKSRANLSSCKFVFDKRAIEGAEAFFQWRMHYAHPKIARGREQTLRGCSMITAYSSITYHEDFYDLGSMLYEHVPLLGWATRKIKSTMAEG